MSVTTSANRYLREHVRYTGDGLPNEPIGAPLPLGDPRSGIYNPPKADLRSVFGEIDIAVQRAEDAADAAEAGAAMVFRNAKDQGATGDGTTNDTTNLSATFTAAGSTGTVYFPPGTYLVTGNIPGFHTVQKFGPGVVKFGTDLFPVAAVDASTVTVWVNFSSGNDANMGLAPSNAVSSMQAAFDILKKYGFLKGSWNIKLSAGTWTGAIGAAVVATGIISQKPIIISGPDVATNVQPTAIISGTGAPTRLGWQFLWSMNIMIIDIDFRNWALDTAAAAIHVGDSTQLYLRNVWGSGNNWGVEGRRGSDVFVEGGKWVNNTDAAFQFFSATSFNIGAAATGVGTGPTHGPTINNNGYGVRCWEGCAGHFDYVSGDGNGVLCMAQETSKITVQGGGNFKNNGCCFRADINAEVSYAAGLMNFNFGTGDANDILSRQYSGGNVRVTGAALQPTRWIDYSATASVTVTGTVAETDLLSYTIPAGTMCYGGAGVIVEVSGFFSGAGTKALKAYLDGTEIFSSGLTTGATGSFYFHLNVMHAGADAAASQRNVGWMIEGGVLPSPPGGTSTTKNMTQTPMDLKIRWAPGNAAGSVSTTLRTVERIG